MLCLKIIIVVVGLVTCLSELRVSARSSGYNQQPFEVPGEIVNGLTTDEILEAVGEAWQARTLSEALRTVCTQLSPSLYATQLDYIARQLCAPILNSNIERGCSDYWMYIAGDDNPYISLIPGLTYSCYAFNDYNVPGSYDWPQSTYTNYTSNTGFYSNYMTDTDWYPMVAEAEVQGMNLILGIYDVCSETGQGIKKINNIILAVADVFGLSTFNSIIGVRGIFEPYSICGALRLVLGMSPTEYIQTHVNILKYPVADGLEFLQSLDVCNAGSANREIGVLKDLLVVFSGMNEYTFCDYISQRHTREEYLSQGTTILQNIFSISTDTQICSDVLSVVVPLDKTGILYSITSYNLTFASQRRELCTEVVNAYSTSSRYEPTPYVLPPGRNFDSWNPFSNPGEILPNLYFRDLLAISGAVYRSPTIVSGLNIYCIVYESFLLEYISVDVFDLAGLCSDLRRGDTSALENDCLESTVPNIYGSSYPIAFRPVNPSAILMYTVTELLQLRDISETEVCQSIDQLINSQNVSLQYLVDYILDIALTEIIPSVPGFCQHFDEILCYISPYCPDYSYNFATVNPYYPSREGTVSAVEQGFAMFESWILSVFGFEDREPLCQLVVNGIDPITGRVTGDLVSSLKSRIIELLTDFDRCQNLVDTIFGSIPEDSYSNFLRNDNNKNLLFKITGYETPGAFCEASTQYFSETEKPIDPGTFGAHINVIVQVALYIRDLIPS